MKKIIFALCLAVLIITMSIGAFASDEYYRLQDSAEVLAESDSIEILAKLDEISEKHDMDVAILTVDAVEDGLTALEDAMEWYEYLGFSSDGIMLYVSIDDRECRIITTGYGITAVTDAGIGYIFEKISNHISNKDYVTAFNTFILHADDFITQAKNGKPYDIGNMPGEANKEAKEPYNVVTSIIISVVIGFIVSLIITGVWKNQLKSVALQTRATSYVRQGSFNVSSSRDLFLYKVIDRKEKPKKEEGGSSTTKSSSGKTYGGGGGKF